MPKGKVLITVRVTPEERDAVKQMAKDCGARSMEGWARDILLREAEIPRGEEAPAAQWAGGTRCAAHKRLRPCWQCRE